MPIRLIPFSAFTLALLLALSCATTEKAQQEPLVYAEITSDAHKLFIKYPEDWQMQSDADELGSLLFADSASFRLQEDTTGMVGVTSLDRQRVVDELGDVDLEALLAATASEAGVEVLETASVVLDGYEGLQGTVRNPQRDSIRGEIYLVEAANGLVYLIITSYNAQAPAETQQRLQSIFAGMLASLSFQE